MIYSINESKTKPSKKSFFEYIYPQNNIKPIKNTKIKLLNDPPLLKIGMKELNILQENKDNKIILQNFKRIYTSLDTCSIQSIFVLFKSIGNTTIHPIPYMSTNNDIYDINTLTEFKNKFGKLEDNKTTVSGYWNKDYINNIKKINTTINWNFTNNIRGVTKYGFHKFEKELIQIIKYDPSDELLFVSNSTILKNILDRCITNKFNVHKHSIEVTSIWKIDIEYLDEHIKFLKFDKIYPIPNNFKPLDYNEKIDKKFRFIFNNITFPLFKMNDILPIKYLKIMNNKDITHEIKNELNKVKNNSSIKNINMQQTISINTFK